MLEGAHRREFDVLLFWALDRLSREGIKATHEYCDRLQKLGLTAFSHSESWFRLGDPIGELLVSVFAWVAKQESRRISERTIAGMARVRAEGKQLGRPPLPVETRAKLTESLKQGTGIREIARQCGVSHAAVARLISEGKSKESKKYVSAATLALRKVWARKRARRLGKVRRKPVEAQSQDQQPAS